MRSNFLRIQSVLVGVSPLYVDTQCHPGVVFSPFVPWTTLGSKSLFYRKLLCIVAN